MKNTPELLRGNQWVRPFTLATAVYFLNCGLSFAQICPTIAAPLASGSSICSGNEATLTAVASETGSTLTWYDDATAGAQVNTGASFTTDPLTTTISYWVEESVPDCPSSPRTEVVVTVNALPVANAGADITICQGSPVTLGMLGADTYTWNNSILNGVSFTPSATAVYTLTADNGTCTATDEVTVTVSTPSVAGIASASDLSLCLNDLISVSVTGETGSIEWFVQPPGVPIFVSLGTGNNLSAPTQQPTGMYHIKAQVTNGACPGVYTNVIMAEVLPLPDVNGGADQAVCAGTSVTLDATGSPGAYAWDHGISDNVAFTPASTEDYTITVTHANGCIKTDVVTVTVNPIPAVDAGADLTVCPNVEVTLAGSGAATYAWDNGAVDGASFQPTATTTYIVTGTSAAGCVETDEITITVSGIVPTVDAGADQAVCAGSSVALTATGTGIFSWDNGVQQAMPFTATATMTYTATVDNGECLNTDEVTVTVSEPSVAGTASVSETTICAGETVTLSLAGGTGAIEWFIQPDGGAYASAGTGNNLESASLTGIAYTVKAEVTNGACAAVISNEVTITVNALPAADAGLDQAVCEGTEVTLTATGAGTLSWDNSVVDGTAFTPLITTTYTVTADNGTCTNTDEITVTVNTLPTVDAGADLEACLGTSVTLEGSGAEDYAWDNSVDDGVAFTADATTTYSVTGTDVNGCEGTDEVIITVHTLPVVSAGSDQEVCAGTAVTLEGSGAEDYSWDNGIDDGVAFDANATLTYTVTGTDANGCENTDEVTVTAQALPAVPVITADGPLGLCEGSDVVLTSSQATGIVWSGSQTSASITVTTPGVFTVTYTDVNGCSSTSAASTVTVNPVPVASAVLSNYTTITVTPAGQTYQWINCTTNQVVAGETGNVLVADANGSYKVIVTTTSGCRDTSACINVTSVGLDENTADLGITLYPNPTEGNVYVNMTSAAQAGIVVYDAQGKIVSAMDNVQNGAVISLSHIESGMYLIHVSSVQGSNVFRVMKN